ncbi:MAG TPA: alpha/beta hydrolase fold domain-containing protein [Thermoanaerobaculia bacterium]|jgi:acetyl esterase/lipase|nr:alpha/beta hydrolase fold domain-containing protein [Thermoanaerobaculia bacterium]
MTTLRRLATLAAVAGLALGTTAHAAPPAWRKGGQPRGQHPPGGPARMGPTTYVAHKDLVYSRPGRPGSDLKLDLYLPKTDAAAKVPVIVWIHGGGWRQGSKDGWGTARAFVERGYAVASIDYRLSQQAIWPAQIEDCKAAVRFLRSVAATYGLDPDHFAAWGESSGGHLAAMVGTAGDSRYGDSGMHLDQSARVQAVVDFYGPIDFVRLAQTKGYGDHAKDSSAESQLLGGSLLSLRAEAKTANPITYLSSTDPPFYIVHGDSDTTIAPAQSELLRDALQQAGIEQHYTLIPGAGHGGQQYTWPKTQDGVQAFLDRQLKGNAAPAAARRSTPAAPAAGQIEATPQVVAAEQPAASLELAADQQLTAAQRQQLEQLAAHHQALRARLQAEDRALLDRLTELVASRVLNRRSGRDAWQEAQFFVRGAIIPPLPAAEVDTLAAYALDGVAAGDVARPALELRGPQMSFNLQYLGLQMRMQDANRTYTAVSNIMKTKHDTVKNSISNVR